jgi:Response regulator containing a CheY-like receiver domain and an HTH DNA-binding domain
MNYENKNSDCGRPSNLTQRSFTNYADNSRYGSCGTAADGQEGLDQVKALNPDVVLTDIRMPGMDGITMLKEIRKRNPNLPVVVLTTFDDQKPIQEAMQMGAKGFLLKDAEKETYC